jgi:hypothetical protein
MHKTGYSSTDRELERYRTGGGVTNRTSITHLEHPWEESRQNNVRQPKFFTPKLNGWSPDVAENQRRGDRDVHRQTRC